MAGQGGKYSAVGAFERLKRERDSAERNCEYWKKRAHEEQTAAYNAGKWSGVIGTLGFAVLFSIGVLVFFV